MLINTQFALFFTDVIQSPTNLFVSLQQSLSSVYDDEATVIPIPADAPDEIPSVIMRSKNGCTSINISRSRLDVFVNHSFSSNKTVEWNRAVSLLDKVLAACCSIQFSRFGCSSTFFKESNEPVKEIRTYFANEIFDDACKELSFRSNVPRMIDSHQYNYIHSMRNAEIPKDGHEMQGVLTIVDINSDPAIPLISSNNIRTVIELSGKAVESEGAI